MSEKIESEDGKLDLIKVGSRDSDCGRCYLTLILISLRNHYCLETLGLLVAAGAAGWIGAQTIRGRAFVNLCLDARVEIRKVVWPTRQETTQTTIVVLIVIFIVAFILWLLDWGLNGVISSMIG